jgi:Flp pilus assembly protein TadG
MTRRKPTARQRGAAAAVEAAFVLPVLAIIMLGLWEVGRLIQVQQVVSNSAREGARVAGQSQIINLSGTPTQIQLSTGSPCVKDTVVHYLQEANLPVTSADVTVTFAFTSGDTTLTEPYQGSKGQRFIVTVSIPVDKVRWSALSLTGVTQIQASVCWVCLVDDPFTLDTTLPTW